jgi:hypothetical protein
VAKRNLFRDKAGKILAGTDPVSPGAAASLLPHEPLDGEKLTASAPLKMLRASWRICLTSDETNGSDSKFDGNGAGTKAPVHRRGERIRM